MTTTFQIRRPVDLTQGAYPSVIANLAQLRDIGEPRTINMMKHGRPWESGTGTTYSSNQLIAGGYTDYAQKILGVPSGLTSFKSQVYGYSPAYVSASVLSYINDHMVLTWTGTGAVSVSGVGVSNITTPSAHRLEFDFGATHVGSGGNADATIIVNVSATGLNFADLLDNFELIPASHAAAYAAGKMFRQDMVASLANRYAGARYMDWGQTNGSPITTWSDRPLPSWANWRSAKPRGAKNARLGVPLEAQIAMSNEMYAINPKCNVAQFCTPDMADDTYVTNMATLVRDTLNPAIKACPAYSNETWNNGFDQYDFLRAQALALWGVSGTYAQSDYHAYRSTKIMQIWEGVFSAPLQAKRLRRLLETHASSTLAGSDTDLRLNAPAWAAVNTPTPWVDPKLHHDVLATTGYFGQNVLADNSVAIKSQLDADIAAPDVNFTATVALINSYLAATGVGAGQNYVANVKANLTALKAIADAAGLKFWMYENNCHIVANLADSTNATPGGVGYSALDLNQPPTSGFSPVPGLIDMLSKLYASAGLEVYRSGIRDHFKAIGGGYDNQYSDIDTIDVNGFWAAQRYMGDTGFAPGNGLVSWQTANPRSFFA